MSAREGSNGQSNPWEKLSWDVGVGSAGKESAFRIDAIQLQRAIMFATKIAQSVEHIAPERLTVLR
jgi:hypothetical protein